MVLFSPHKIHGIKPASKKEASLLAWTIARPFLPDRVRIPVRISPTNRAKPCVAVGDEVKIGQMIAMAEDEKSVPVYASLSGKVTGIDFFPHSEFSKAEAIEIRMHHGHSVYQEHLGQPRANWEQLSREEKWSILRSSGVIDLRTTKALHEQDGKAYGQITTLILNGCESEPYVTSAHALMMSHPVEVLKGAEILKSLLGAEKILIVLQDNAQDVVEKIKSKIYFHHWNHIEVQALPWAYPQEHSAVLLKNILGLDIWREKERTEAVRIHDAATAFAVYEAIVLQKPFYERAVTIGGECVIEPKNVWLPAGISLTDAFKYGRGFLREPRKVITGGPLTGTAQQDLESAVSSSVSAILALPKEVAVEGEIEPCIRCQRCVEACPADISPAMIALAAEKELFDLAEKWGASDCIECGNCSFVCPANRPMVELIRYADTYLMHRKEKKIAEFSKDSSVSIEVETEILHETSI